MGMNKPSAPAAVINSPQASKGGRQAPAASGVGPSKAVGPMNSANMAGAFKGGSAELKAQHPIEHYDHGPHHGTDHHRRHKPTVMK